MSKRITSMVIAFVMVFSVIGLIPAKAEAATNAKYVLLSHNNWECKAREKVGNYYVWVDMNEKTGVDTLKCAKLLGITPKVLKKVSGKNDILGRVLTNGENIYYAVGTHGKYLDTYDKVTVYKTDVKGKTTTTVKTFTDFHSLAGFYNGKLYYTGLIDGFYEGSLYSYNVSTKKVKLIKKGYGVAASQGNNIVYWGENDPYRYNAATGKFSKLPEAEEYSVNGNNIYYWEDYDEDSVLMGFTVSRVDLNGKNKKIVKTINYKNWDDMDYFGYKNVFFRDKKGNLHRYNYEGKYRTSFARTLNKTTLNSVKASGNKTVTVKWNQVDRAKKYQVYRATAKNGTYKLVKTTKATNWKNTGLTKGKTYYYKVRALNYNTVGAYSAVKAVKVK